MHRHVEQYAYQLMGVFCDRIMLGSTTALDCQTVQNKGKYCKKEFLLLLVLLSRVQTECCPLTDRNFVDNFLQLVIYLALVANI